MKKGHTEQRRAQRFYIAEIVRHRGTVGAWRNRGYLRVFINTLVYFITKQWFVRFLKTFITKAISNMYTTSLSLFVPSAPPWDCLLHLRVLLLSVCLLYVVRLILSLHISEEPKERPFLYSKSSIEMVFFNGLFQTVRLSKWYLHFDTSSCFYIY